MVYTVWFSLFAIYLYWTLPSNNYIVDSHLSSSTFSFIALLRTIRLKLFRIKELWTYVFKKKLLLGSTILTWNIKIIQWIFHLNFDYRMNLIPVLWPYWIEWEKNNQVNSEPTLANFDIFYSCFEFFFNKIDLKLSVNKFTSWKK